MSNPISDLDFARELVRRLNALRDSSPHAAALLEERVKMKLPAPPELVSHPTIQVCLEDGEVRAGLMGILNGIAGAIPHGPREGYGYVAACFTLSGKFIGFGLTDEYLEAQLLAAPPAKGEPGPR